MERCGRIAIVGKSNVGKSTLINRLIGHKVSITSNRPQTTRKQIIGILNRGDGQFIFIDTPGWQHEPSTNLDRLMNKFITYSLSEVDVILWVLEALKFDCLDKEILALIPEKNPVVLGINKIDRIRDRHLLLPYIHKLSTLYKFSAIVPCSAKATYQIDTLLDVIAPLLPLRESCYGVDTITTQSERFMSAELVREKILKLTKLEIPYSTGVAIEKFERQDNLLRIHAMILVEKSGQKAIVIGKNGGKLKSIARLARMDMEKLFSKKVYLKLWVKVEGNWRKKTKAIHYMEYV